MAGRTVFTKHALAVAAVAISLLLPGALSVVFPPWNGIGPEVTPDLTRSSTPPTGHLLAQDIPDPCSPITPLIVDPTSYEDRCSSPLNGPCFQLVGASMTGVSVEPWFEPVNITDSMLLAQDSATAFAMMDPSVAFEIDFHSYGDLKFRYLNYDSDTNCYDVTLERKRETVRKQHWRMTVGETEDEIALDTLNSHYTSTRFCTDKLFIKIGRA
ncbi:probable Mig1 protein, induced during biotrophic phase [Sporisorium reilianum f. sp. reilianum]|uniref:Probable Mig1 protein, induced during biotrophic phase n=1 Tax=Sporisorium reilianum f. sp. reilianum TaxID=72559 RepID=A0A2N8UEP8_9BASI|nr:probable Mig1 protein, induced during biotrophic phase [Sporisorium reilianum f. sp. reilianum]